MSGRTIEAKAIISAADKTGNVLDKIAAKFRGLEKNAKAMEGIKPLRFTGNLEDEMKRLRMTEKEMQSVRKAQAALSAQLLSDPIGRRSSMYFRALDDWKNKTVSHWREVKAGVDDTEKAHRKFFASAGAAALRWGMVAGGLGSGAYAAGVVGKAGIKAAATAQRESARDYLAGMTPEDSKRIEDEALRASRKYQSVDSQTMHERLRDTAMGMRSTDKAIELADTIGQMTTVLQSLKGKDAAIEEGRKFFSALDVLGKNIDPKEVKDLADGYIKALGVEGADMDLGGMLTMARQSRAAGGILSNRFLTTTAPGLARDLGDPQLGTALASALSQNIGGRATATSKEAQQEFGLRDKNGNFIDSRMAMGDPDKWAWERLMPALQKKGVDVNDNVKVTEALSKLFSNRTVNDVFSKLITQRDQYQGKAAQYERAPGLSAAGPMMGKDPFVAYEAVFAQLRTFAGQAPVMDAAAQGLNTLSGAISGLNDAVKEDGWLSDLGKEAKKTWDTTKREWEAVKGIGGKLLEWDRATGIDPKWVPFAKSNSAYPLGEDPMGADYSRRAFHSKEYWNGLGREGASVESAARLRRERMQWPDSAKMPSSFAVPGVSPTMTYGTGVNGDKVLAVHGDVRGEAELSVTFNAGTELVTIVEQARQVIKMAGQITGNGVGSTGKSSPDAAAPSAPHVGSAGNSPL